MQYVFHNAKYRYGRYRYAGFIKRKRMLRAEKCFYAQHTFNDFNYEKLSLTIHLNYKTRDIYLCSGFFYFNFNCRVEIKG